MENVTHGKMNSRVRGNFLSLEGNQNLVGKGKRKEKEERKRKRGKKRERRKIVHGGREKKKALIPGVPTIRSHYSEN